MKFDSKVSPRIYIHRGGGGTAKSVTYDNPTYTNVQDALDALLVPSLVITSFTNNISTREYGEVVTSVTFNWSVNKTLTLQSLNNGIGSIDASLRTYTHDSQSITSNRTYTLSVSTDTETATANTTIAFSHKRYWGASSLEDIDDTGIINLSKEFASSRTMTKTMSGSGEYLYICYPASWGTATFKVNGLPNTAWILTTRNFVNASGYTESYNIYRSVYLQHGSGIEVQVL